jgi:tRNA1(Val) A37 N6-methylase TrmN6
MTAAAAARGFVPTRITEVHSTPKSGPKRTLIEFSRAPAPATTQTPAPVPPPEIDTLIISDAPGTFSRQYRALTADFYLYF